MAYQTLYRKYRPKTFEKVYGQDTIIKTLKNIIKNKKLGHAYLFTGPRGTGKTSTAKLFAKAINCENPINGDVCNECENCNSFNNNGNPDIIEIDAASNNGVDEIREIQNKVNLVPSMSKYKVYIIDEVHMLSIGAFNALLKTLEEPPKYIIFILATTEPQKIPATVISRCQRFDFKSIPHDKMKECLKKIIEEEKINVEDAALEEIINISKGGMRDAIGILDQSSIFSDEKVTVNDIEQLSGNVSIKEIRKLLNNIINKNYKTIFDSISSYSLLGKDFSLICEKIINYVRIGILYKKNIIDKNHNVDKEDIMLYNSLNDYMLYLILDFLTNTLIKLKDSYQKELTFEVQIIQLVDEITNFSLNKASDVSRGTSKNINIKEKNIKNETNVPRGTLSENVNFKINNEKNTQKNIVKNKIETIKNIRINNILKEATKDDINFIINLWNNISDYLINEKYKIVAGILKNAKPVAASKKGMIITLPLDSTINRIENEYDNSKELIKKIYNNTYKLVYITDNYWQKIRPEYVEKIKNKTLKLIDEENILDELKKIIENNSVYEFNELIEMEEN